MRRAELGDKSLLSTKVGNLLLYENKFDMFYCFLVHFCWKAGVAFWEVEQ